MALFCALLFEHRTYYDQQLSAKASSFLSLFYEFLLYYHKLLGNLLGDMLSFNIAAELLSALSYSLLNLLLLMIVSYFVYMILSIIKLRRAIAYVDLLIYITMLFPSIIIVRLIADSNIFLNSYFSYRSFIDHVVANDYSLFSPERIFVLLLLIFIILIFDANLFSMNRMTRESSQDFSSQNYYALARSQSYSALYSSIHEFSFSFVRDVLTRMPKYISSLIVIEFFLKLPGIGKLFLQKVYVLQNSNSNHINVDAHYVELFVVLLFLMAIVIFFEFASTLLISLIDPRMRMVKK